MINCYKNVIESGIKSAIVWGKVLKEGLSAFAYQ